MKTSARQTAAEPVGPATAEAAPAGKELAGLELARRRLDEAIARLEKDVAARIAQARSESAARVTALETEVAKLKAEKRELERASAELRKAAEAAGTRVDHAIGQVRAVLGEEAGGG